MNLPSGKTVKTGIDVASTDFIGLLRELSVKRLTGYLAITVRGATAVEEGIVLFDDGKLVATVYEYPAHNAVLHGQKAFYRVLNASNARNGVIDIIQLPAEQLKLALAFNEKAVFLPPEMDLATFKPSPFIIEFEREVAPVAGVDARDVYTKYKLGDVKVPENVDTAPVPPAPPNIGTSENDFKRLITKL